MILIFLFIGIRIYFDKESQRYEIGSGLSEPEIDWLYSQLAAWSN